VTALIVREPTLVITYTGPVAVDLSNYLVAAEMTSEAEMVDVGTFGAPMGQDTGRRSDSITLALLWSDALHTLLAAHVNAEGDLVFTPDSGDASTLTCKVKYGAVPYGRFELGQKVEVDLVLAIVDELTYA
jgi:hypothetical protein